MKLPRWLVTVLPLGALCAALLGAGALVTLSAPSVVAPQTAAALDLNGPLSQFDTRPCVNHPSQDTCTGQFPVAPLGTVFTDGSGACIDQRSQMIAFPLTDATQQQIGELDLWWSPTCTSAFAYVSVDNGAPASHLLVTLTSYTGYIINDPRVIERTTLDNATEAYSPLIYSPANAVNACSKIVSQDGSANTFCTPMLLAGVPQ